MIADLRARTLELFRPVPRPPLSQWIEQNIWLPQDLSSTPGPIKLWPWQIELADAMGDPDLERITVLKSARIGYSSLLIGMIGFYLCIDPSPVLVVTATDDDARSFILALENTFAASPTLRNVLPNPRSGSTERDTLKYRRGAGWSLRVVSARAPRNLRASTAKIVITDETDIFEVTVEGHAVPLAEKRSLTYDRGRKLVHGSSPTTTSTSYVANAYEQSDRRVFEVPCPTCSHYSEITWASIRWPKGEPKKAEWVCPACGTYHDESRKVEMVSNGRFRALSPEVENHRGYKINCLSSLHANAAFGRLAEEFTQATKPELLRVWTTTLLGEPWRDDEDDGLQAHELMTLAAPVDLDRIPASVLWLTSGVDIQTAGGGRLEICTIGFTADDEWIVLDHRQIFGDPAKNELWTDLADLLAERYPHPLGGTIQRSATAVDAGDGHVMDAVLGFAAGHRDLRVIPIKGASGSRPPLSPTASKRSRSLMVAGVDGAKQKLYDRLTRREGIRFSDKLPEDWFTQLTSERATVRYSRGQPTRQWTRFQGRTGDSLDAAVYSLLAKTVVAADPVRRVAELGSRVALRPPMPVTIRSAWLENR